LEAQIAYSSAQNVPMYCNGSQWIAMGKLNPSAGGAGCATATMGIRSEGSIFYNLDFHVLQYCDGDNWRAVGVGTVGCADDSTPDAFAFTDQTDALESTLVVSNIVQIVGVIGSPAVAISGDGAPEFRTCVNSDCSIVIQNWTSSSGTIQGGNFLQLRLTTNTGFNTLNSATVTVGAASDQWDVTTLAQDTTPDAFSFTDQTNIALNALTTSNSATINGITGGVSVSVSGDGTPQVRINGGSWVTSGTIADGQTLEVRLTSNAAFSAMNSATVTVGTVSDQWDVTTVAQDAAPDAFSFTDQLDVALNALITSNSVTITGITGSVSVSVSGAGSPQVRINGGAWVTSGSIASGETLEVRLTSANVDSTIRSATVTVGTGSDQWDVTTQDATPGAFAFTDQTDVALNTLITSNAPTITGITGTVSVSVSGTGSPQVRVNGGTWTAGPTTITNGQTLEVRLTSANADSSMNSATVTVGSASDQWDVTTQDATPNAFSFTDVTLQALNTVITSNSATINGITGTVAVSVSGAGSPQVRVNGGSWTAGPTTITNGQSLEVRLTSANADSTMRSATVTVGASSDQWDVTTQDVTPDAFSFTDVTAQALNTVIASNSATINGITGTVAVSVSGAGSPQVRVNGGSWTAGPTTITNGQTLEVRLTSANADLTMRSATVTVGSGSDQWDVTTNDNAPTAFNFTDQTGVAQSTLTTSNSLTISGITGSVAVSVSGAGSPQIRINGGSWVTSGTITSGQSLEVRLTSNASYSTMNSATVTVGSGSDQWDVTTLAPPFSLDFMEYRVTGNLSQATYNFTTVNFGADVANRYIVVAAQTDGGNHSISGVTIGGVTATLVVQNGNGGTEQVSLWIAQPTGTSGTVTLTMATAPLAAGVMVYRMTNPSSATAYHTATGTGVSGVISMNLNIPSGGAGIAAAGEHTTSPVPGTKAWSGLTKDFEADTWAYDDITSAHGGTPGTTQAISATSSVTAPYFAFRGVAASWGP
jgi:hypothetical protein